MDRISRLTFALMLLLSAEGLHAGEPSYLILRSTPMTVTHEPLSAPKRAESQRLDAQPYAYGWFGAQPRRHWSRHFGYYRNYTEWSAK